MRNHATPETGWRVVGASMAHTMNFERLLEPRTEPMRARDYIGAAIVTVAGIVAFYFWWGVT
jgi:hypothetical protein